MAEDALVEVMRRLNVLEGYVEDVRRKDFWPGVLTDYLMLPELRGMWPCSSVDETVTGIRDLSGQGRTLTINGGATRGVQAGIMPYVIFDGTDDHLSRADEAGLDITGGLTLGGWFYLSGVAATQALITKYNVTGNQRAYALYFFSTGVFRFLVSGDGIAVPLVESSGFTITAARWYWVAGRYTPSTELALFVGDRPLRKFVNTTSLPASAFNSSSEFRVGSFGDSSSRLTGRGTQIFISAANLSDEVLSQVYARSRGQFGI